MKTDKLKQLIAEAMYAGSLLSDRHYSGAINAHEYAPFVSSLKKMQALLSEAFSDHGDEAIDLAAIFPLQEEIEIVI